MVLLPRGVLFLRKIRFPLYISPRLCYNDPDATGKRVEIPHEPVAVSRMYGTI